MRVPQALGLLMATTALPSGPPVHGLQMVPSSACPQMWGAPQGFWAGDPHPGMLLPTTPQPQPRVHLTSSHPSLLGKKDGETDQNFDMLDLPKQMEAAKGEPVTSSKASATAVGPSSVGNQRCGVPQRSLGTCTESGSMSWVS